MAEALQISDDLFGMMRVGAWKRLGTNQER